MISLAIVAAFLLMILLSATGLIAKNWTKEVGINYAPPSFLGPGETATTEKAAAEKTAEQAADAQPEIDVVDPLADALAAIKAGATKPGPATAESPADAKGVDPLADVMADIKAKGSQAETVVARAATLPLGGDKWGRDVLKKVVKGSETSIFVGIASAIVAVFLGSLFGAVAGYYGGLARRRFQLVLQRFYRDTLPAADPGRRRGAAAARAR